MFSLSHRRLFSAVRRSHSALFLAALTLAAPAGASEAVPVRQVATAGTPADYLKRLSLEELLAVDVTSVSRRPEPWAATASAISVLAGDDIRRSGATSLADALRFSSGLDVARIDGRTWGVASRGFNLNASNKLLVLLDGRSLYTPLFSGVFWDVQDTDFEDIAQIEIVRGPGATLWGANAVNGVIGIRTKSARDTLGTAITAGGGGEERTFASLRHGLELGDGIFGRIYVKTYDRGDLELSNGADAHDGLRMAQGGFRVDGQSKNAPTAWTVQGDIYHGFLGGSGGPDSRVAGGNVLGRSEHTLAPDTTLTAQVYYDRVERYVPRQFREWRDTFDGDLQLNAAIGARQQLVAGLNARTSDDRTSERGTVRFSPRDRRMTVASGFLQDEVRFMDERLGLTGGAKFEHNSSTGFEFQPSLRAAWRPNAQHTWWTAVSRAVRTPSRFDDDLRFGLPTGVTFIRGDPSFRSETLLAYEAGYRLHLRRGWAVDVSLFANRYDHLRSQEQAGEPGVAFVLQNRLNARTCGGELSFVAQLTPAWRVRATYARLHKSLSLDPGSTDLTGGAQEGDDPAHHATLTSSWDLPRHWEFDVLLRHVGARPAPAVPAYTEADIRLGWQPAPAWELALVGQNLLHASHREFGAAGPTAREIPRSGYAKITWRR